MRVRRSRLIVFLVKPIDMFFALIFTVLQHQMMNQDYKLGRKCRDSDRTEEINCLFEYALGCTDNSDDKNCFCI